MELRKDNRPILSFAKLKSVMPMPLSLIHI